jgi:methyltransferase-like protein
VDLFAAVPPTLDPAIRRRITSFAGSSRSEMEQHIDFLTGRLFRRSVLVRRQQSDGPKQIPGPDQLTGLHIASPIHLDAAQSTYQVATFSDDHERPITTADPVIRQAIERLARAYPATLSLDELTAFPGGEPHNIPAEVEARVRRAIFTMVLAGRASISVLPLRVGRADHEHPTAWHLARMEASSGQPWITSLHHAGVPAHPILKILLPYLDGAHDRSALRARLTDALQRGVASVPELAADQPPLSEEGFGAVVEQYVEQTLRHLARHALLEPDRAEGDLPGDRSSNAQHAAIDVSSANGINIYAPRAGQPEARRARSFRFVAVMP